MTPNKLVAEGPMPGRPSLLGATIKIEMEGVVTNESKNGVWVQTHDGLIVLVFPFTYEIVKDAK